ncbi:MAG: Bug family tripartite tricarboxylate transporter substrate binding protein [Burkholderiales bacterium]
MKRNAGIFTVAMVAVIGLNIAFHKLLTRRIVATALGLLLVHALHVTAQDYPTKVVKVITPFPPGGGVDILARLIAEKLQVKWGQSVIVENRAGAGGNVGTEFAWRAAPDGYSLLVTAQAPLVINKSLYAKLNYDPDTFTPVSVLATAHSVLVSHPKVPVETVPQLIAHAKANPDKLNYSSPGVGNPGHLTAELFKSMAGVRVVHVPYNGTGPALAGLLSGQVELLFGQLSSVLPHVRAGKLKLLAVASEKRYASLPNTPVMAETLPGFLSATWWGMVAPPGTPSPITEKLSAAIAEAVKQPDFAKRLGELGFEAGGGTPAEMALFMRQERERWGGVIRAVGAKADD